LSLSRPDDPSAGGGLRHDGPKAYPEHRVQGPGRGLVGRLTLHPDLSLAASTPQKWKTIRLWDLAGGQQLVEIKAHPKRIGRLTLSADGKRLLAGTRKHTDFTSVLDE
jgi:WD40 repeat protein